MPTGSAHRQPTPGLNLADCVTIVVTVSPWDEPPRIRHQLTRQLARFGPVCYVELPSAWRTARTTTTETVAPGIRVVRLANPQRVPRRVPLHFAPARRALHRAFMRELDRVVADVPPARRVMVNFDYAFAEALAPERSAVGVYVCNDDFRLFVSGERAKRRVALYERQTAQAADVCYAVSEELRRRLCEANPDVRLLLPGHDFDLGGRDPSIRRGGGTRAAFMGYIDDRLDFDALEALVADGVELELVGPVATTAPAFVRLREHPLVRVFAPLTGPALQARLQAVDVLLMPYDLRRYDSQRVVTAPNKLFSYIAASRPVVSTAMPNLLTFAAGVVYTADTTADYVAAVHRARDEDSPALQRIRRGIAEQNTWTRRGDEFRADVEVLLRSTR